MISKLTQSLSSISVYKKDVGDGTLLCEFMWLIVLSNASSIKKFGSYGGKKSDGKKSGVWVDNLVGGGWFGCGGKVTVVSKRSLC